MKNPFIPNKINSNILNFCDSISPGLKPLFVKVIPSLNSVVGQCFYNVPKHVENNGGEIQFGWCIYIIPNIFIEAEFHAVWQKSPNELVDITKRSGKEDRILFLPDNQKRFEGQLVDNIRKALKNCAQARVLIQGGLLYFELQKKYYDGHESKIPYKDIVTLNNKKMELWKKECLNGEDVPKEIKTLFMAD